MAKDLDTGYFDPAQSAMNGGFGDLAAAAMHGEASLNAMEEEFVDYDQDKDLQDVISLGLHMAD